MIRARAVQEKSIKNVMVVKIKGSLWRGSLAIDESVADRENRETNDESRPTRSDLVSPEIDGQRAHRRSKSELKEFHDNPPMLHIV